MTALAAGAVTAASLAVLLSHAPAVMAGETVRNVWTWVPEIGLNLTFRLDGLSLLFAGLILFIGLLIVLYAHFYLSPKDSVGKFYSEMMLFMAAMLGVVLSDNLLLLVVFWELTSLSSFLLVGYWGHKAEARAGARMALAMGARWLAFTDADTTVAPAWLHEQVSLDSDAVCGTVSVTDWGVHGEPMRRHFNATYTDADGHQHIHGANLGVSAQAYHRAGGFAPLASSEDVAFVRALQAVGARIAWSAAPRVVTSARHVFRAPGGFGATLLGLNPGLSTGQEFGA